jgi:hypothetical protein
MHCKGRRSRFHLVLFCGLWPAKLSCRSFLQPVKVGVRICHRHSIEFSSQVTSWFSHQSIDFRLFTNLYSERKRKRTIHARKSLNSSIAHPTLHVCSPWAHLFRPLGAINTCWRLTGKFCIISTVAVPSKRRCRSSLVCIFEEKPEKQWLPKDSAPNLGPLISRWEINEFENCWYKSVRIFEVLKLLFQPFSNLVISQRDRSGPIIGDRGVTYQSQTHNVKIIWL